MVGVWVAGEARLLALGLALVLAALRLELGLAGGVGVALGALLREALVEAAEEELRRAPHSGAVTAHEDAHRLERVEALVSVLLVHAVEQLPQALPAERPMFSGTSYVSAATGMRQCLQLSPDCRNARNAAAYRRRQWQGGGSNR